MNFVRTGMLAALAAVPLWAGTGTAADRTWVGGASTNNWSVGANWGGTAPVTNDYLYFGGAAGPLNTNNLTAGTPFGGLTFNSGAGAFSIAGNLINLNGGITNNSTSLQTVSLALALQQHATLNAAGGNVALGGIVSGAFMLTKQGSSTGTLSAANTYSGGTTVAAGVLVVTNAAGLGTGIATVSPGAVLQFQPGNVSVTYANYLTGGGTVKILFNGTTANNVYLSGASGFGGTIQLSATGATGNKWNAINLGTINAALLIDSGCQIFPNGVGSTVIANGITVSGTGNNESGNRGAIRLAGTLGGTLSLVGNTTIGGEGGTLLGDITNGAAGAVTLTFYSAGNGTLAGNIGGGNAIALTQSGAGVLVLSGANSYDGATTLSAGTVSVGADHNLGAAAAPLTFNGGTLRVTGTAVTDFGAHPPTFTAAKTVGLDIADAGNTFTVGQVLSQTTGGLTKYGSGTLRLTAANTFSGAVTVNGGTLRVAGATGSLNTGATLVFGGTGTFDYDNAGAGAPRAQNLGALTANAGDGTVQLTRTDEQYLTLNLASLARAAGATVNFVTVGGVNGSDNSINISAQGQGFINQGSFFGGADYAYVDTAGTFVRAPVYGTDGGFTAADTIAADTHTLLTATPAAQDNLSLTTLKLAGGGVGFTLNDGQTLTLAGGGLLKTGGGAAGVIGGGSGVTPGSGASLVVRTEAGADSLTFNTPILANGANVLTKSGAGTLTLAATNTYTGATAVNNGTLLVDGAGSLGAGAYAAAITNAGALVFHSSATQALSGVLSGAGSLTQRGAGPLTLAAANTFTGPLTVQEGTLLASNATAISSVGFLTLGDASGLSTAPAVLDTLIGFTFLKAINVVGGNQINMIRDSANTTGYNGPITLSGANLTLNQATNAAQIYNGGISGTGNLIVSSTGTGGSISLSALPVNPSGAITNNGSGTAATTINSVVGPNVTVIVQNSGTSVLTLSATNTFTIPIVINAGTLAVGGAGLLGAGDYAVPITNNGVFAYGSSQLQTLSGVLSGGGALTQSGTGTLTLDAANSYGGVTTIGAGTLKLGVAGAIPDGAALTVNGGAFNMNGLLLTVGVLAGTGGSITNAAGLTVNQSADSTNASAIVGAGSLTKTGPGLLALSGTSSFSGGTRIAQGTLAAAAAGALGAGPVTNETVLNLTATTAGDITYTGLSNALSGAGTVNVWLLTGTSTRLLNGNYSGFTGTWNIGTNAAAGGGKVQMNGADNAATTVNVLSNGTVYVVGAVTKQAALVLNGGDTGEPLGQIRLEGTANWTGPVTLAGNITGVGDNAVGCNNGTGTISGVIGEAGGARSLGKGGNGTLVLAGANTFSGPTTVGAGVLIVSNRLALQNSTLNPTNNNFVVRFGAGITDYTLGGLCGPGNLGLTNASGAAIALTVGGNGFSTNYTGVLSAGGSLVKVGTGVQTLSGTNTYSGVTIVSNGTLRLGAAGSIGATPLIDLASAGATADVSAVSFHLLGGQQLRGVGTLQGGLIMDPGALLSPGHSAGTLTVTGDLTLNTGTTNYFDLVGPASGDRVDVGGTLSLGGIQFTDFVFNPDAGLGAGQTYTLFRSSAAVSGALGAVTNGPVGAYEGRLQIGGASNDELQLTVIPEPATFGIVGLFAVAALWRRRRPPPLAGGTTGGDSAVVGPVPLG